MFAGRLGREAANVLRRKLGVRLRAGVRASDVVASLGDDGFAVLLGSILSPADAHRVLLAFDAQSHPTAFLVRATAENLSRVDLEGFALWIDVDDPSVSAFIRHDHAWEAHVSRVLTTALRTR